MRKLQTRADSLIHTARSTIYALIKSFTGSRPVIDEGRLDVNTSSGLVYPLRISQTQ